MARLAMAAALTICIAQAEAAQESPPTPPKGVATGESRCEVPGRAHSRILAATDRTRQAWVELEVTRARNRCRLRWVLHVSTNSGKRFNTVTVAEAPPLGERNAFDFELVAFTATGSRVLAVRNESLGDWTSRTAVIYDFGTRALQTQDVNGRIERLPPDECPVSGDPIGFASDDSVAIVVVSSDDVDDDAFRCWPEAQWALDMRTGEVRRLPAGARVMAAGVPLDYPAGRDVSGSRPGP